MSSTALDGAGVLVTRPEHQVDELRAAIEDALGVVILFPTIEIRPVDKTVVEAAVATLPTSDITIFISRNAVEHGLDYATGQVAAIGPATADAIRAGGHIVDICPNTGFDSEHLLADPAFGDVSGRKIRIIRGEGGREYLANALEARGARVDYVSCYTRTLPAYDKQSLQALEQRWRDGDVSVIVVMSVQSLENLGKLLPKWCRSQLGRTPLVTPSARVLKGALAQYSGCPATLAASPRPGDIVEAIAVAHESATRKK